MPGGHSSCASAIEKIFLECPVPAPASHWKTGLLHKPIPAHVRTRAGAVCRSGCTDCIPAVIFLTY
jgi:hypothetical protein